jgi:hypothetical protein
VKTPQTKKPRLAPALFKVAGAALAGLSLGCLLLVSAGCAGPRDSTPVHGPTFNGAVQSVDNVNHRLTIAPLKAAPPVVFLWNDESRFWANGLRIEPTRLESGDVVRIHFRSDSEPKTIQHLYLSTDKTIH